ncbi:MAG: hypothetical protein NTU44_19550 [Bacteroidetes bacterium]|nr:hypothetical protein [Bacteroidota bacterium]
MKNTITFIAITLNFSYLSVAQQPQPKPDSASFYKYIESFSGRRKVTRLLYQSIFKPVEAGSNRQEDRQKADDRIRQYPAKAFEGKIIRNINIETLDPFGYSVSDTSIVTEGFLERAGNRLHRKSKEITIRNLLLIRKNKAFDSLLVRESERLIRSRGYVHEVSFTIKATSPNSDSVDVFIRVLDNWSILPIVTATPARLNFRLSDKNFLGLGHESKNGYTWYPSTGKNAYNAAYLVPNIRNTYISGMLFYTTDENRNFTRSLEIVRPFFSPFARWAAGISISQEFRRDSIRAPGSHFIQQRFKFNTQDYWVGRAVQIFKGNTENDRTTNFISAFRIIKIHYLEKPSERIDILRVYSDEEDFLLGVGISARKYVRDKYVFKYGLTEDVPVGRIFSLTGGLQRKYGENRLYLGARFSSGRYFKWGYLSTDLEYGTFLKASTTQQGALRLGLQFFTDLFEIGNWKFRQFVEPQLTIGFDRPSSDTLTLNNRYGLDGFNSPVLSGSSRFVFALQTQSYAPFSLIGFRFGPYLNYSIGMIGREAGRFSKSRLFSEISLGVLFRNENLIISTFQISFSYFPEIPGNGRNLIKVNSFKTADLGFRDVEIGKPSVINFQ